MFLIPSAIKADSTVIHNSVSVSANGGENGSENTAYVKTIYNNEVVEEFHISTTSDFIYESKHTTDKGESLISQTKITTNASDFSTDNNVQKLTLLLNNLLTLLDYYEKLLDKQ